MNYYQLNNSKLDELVGNREYIWLKYHRTKIESKKWEYIMIYQEIPEEIKV